MGTVSGHARGKVIVQCSSLAGGQVLFWGPYRANSHASSNSERFRGAVSQLSGIVCQRLNVLFLRFGA